MSAIQFKALLIEREKYSFFLPGMICSVRDVSSGGTIG